MCSKCYCNMLESEKSPDITCHWQGPKSYYASLISLLIYMSCKLHEFHIRCSQISCKFATSAYTTFHIHNIDIVTESILLLGKLPLQLSHVLLWNKYPSCRHNDKICPNGFRARRSKWTAPNLRLLLIIAGIPIGFRARRSKRTAPNLRYLSDCTALLLLS